MNKKNTHKDFIQPSEDSAIHSALRISQIPKSIEFKVNCFSPDLKLSKLEISNTQKEKMLDSNKNSRHTTTNTTSSKIRSNLIEIMEDNEDDTLNSGLNHNINSDIMHKNFLNKSIMDFNKDKNKHKTLICTEPASYSLIDVNTQYRANSENFFNIEEKYSIFEEFQKSLPTLENKKSENKGFHPTFKLDFNNKLPPTDEKVGLSSRLYMNFEEDLKMLKKMREESNHKKKNEKKNVKSNFKEVSKDLQIFQLHENFEKNLELFKKEEEEFLKKIKKINLLEEDSSNENEKQEKSKLEKEFEESLYHIVLEEKVLSKDYDTKKTIKEPSSHVFESKFSKMTIDSKMSSNF